MVVLLAHGECKREGVVRRWGVPGGEQRGASRGGPVDRLPGGVERASSQAGVDAPALFGGARGGGRIVPQRDGSREYARSLAVPGRHWQRGLGPGELAAFELW